MTKRREKLHGDPVLVDVLDDTNLQPLETEVPSQTGAPVATTARPRPESELSPDERRIRELEHQLALERGGKVPEQVFEPDQGAGEEIVIHFVNDGLSVLGKIWCRGEEIRIVKGSTTYQETVDRLGNSWLDLRDNPQGQETRWGQEKFRAGPWPGLSLEEAAKVAKFEALSPLHEGGPKVGGPSEEALRRAAAQARARGSNPPRVLAS